MNKAELRKEFLSLRKNLSEEEFFEINSKLVNQFQNLDFTKFKLLHIFLPIKKNKEPDTYRIHKFLNDTYPNLQFVISKSLLDNPTMYHFLWDNKIIIKNNNWGIPEPIGGIQVMANQIDVVLVPLLIADKKGNRIGYGKGYYDVFLSQCKPDVLKIGISLFPVIDEIKDSSSFDIPLDIIVTPAEIFYIKKRL